MYKNEKEYVNDLNSFYARFDCYDFLETCNDLRSELREQVTHAYDPIATYEVRRSLTKINTNKACGPDRLEMLLRSAGRNFNLYFQFDN